MAEQAMIESALNDARNTLSKTAMCRVGSDDITVPRWAYDSVLRNIDKARATLTKGDTAHDDR